MFKKILPTAVLASLLLASVTGHALTPGFYVDVGAGWGWTELNKTFKDVNVTYSGRNVSLISISDNGFSGHLGVGWLISKYFGLEVAYNLIWTKGAENEVKGDIIGNQAIHFSGTHVIDLVAKGVLPLEKLAPSLAGFNVSIKAGGAFLFYPGHKFQFKATGPGSEKSQTTTGALIANTIAPEIGLSLSYDMNSNFSIYTSITHINTDILGERTKTITPVQTGDSFEIKNPIKPGNINIINLGLTYSFL